MEAPNSGNQNGNNNSGMAAFVVKRVIIAVCLIALVLWALSIAIDNLETHQPLQEKIAESPSPILVTDTPALTQPAHAEKQAVHKADTGKTADPVGEFEKEKIAKAAQAMETDAHRVFDPKVTAQKGTNNRKPAANTHGEPTSTVPPQQTIKETPTPSHAKAPSSHMATAPAIETPVATGVTFVDALMAPISYELNERFWGWRPNDILNVTDNVNSYQLGVLEVTRRSVVQLTERISRTGSTDAFNRNLENAMNWLMVKATRYWFPSPESKYKESLTELARYKKDLILGEASFHTRTDNLIPLLAAYEDLLGSCDENLVKAKETDGSTVGFFKADEYFYYAKGVATTMAHILEAIGHDFETTLKNRHGEELLHHAILSCETASSLEPWIITNADLDGILANHRANMAAPISHARFFIGQLIKTLST